ncbi:MAG: outer membrane lipoprotein carrier protein LolA [Pseudomonadota bacterium]
MKRLLCLLGTLCLLAFGAGGQGALASSLVQSVALTQEDQAHLDRVEAYLNQLGSLQARFVQISSNGAYAEGEVLVDRPGKMRFEYDPPQTILLIANGLSLLYYDRELKQSSYLPLWETPLWFLVREEVKLGGELEVVSIEQALGTLTLSMRDADSPELGQVTLIFSDNPLSLRKWEITDAQGVLTQVSLINPQYGVEIDEEKFNHNSLSVDGSKGDNRR